MKFLKNLFKKEPPPFLPTNRLEELLERASQDAAYRPDFYRQIFHFDLCVIGRLDPIDGSDERYLSMQTRDVDGQLYAYAFTSLDAIKYMLKDSKEQLEYVQIPATNFFQLLLEKKIGFVLNMHLPFGRIFDPAEVAGIYHNDKDNSKAVVFDKETEVQVGIPAVEPKELILALKSFVEKEAGLKEVHLGLQIINNEKTYILVLDLERDSDEYMQRLVQDIGTIIGEVGTDLPVDLAKVNDNYGPIIENGGLIACTKYL
jgi:hypothetical protein